MCTIVNMTATNKAKLDKVDYAWRVHKIMSGHRYSPIINYPIGSVNTAFLNRFMKDGDTLEGGAYHCVRTRRLARKLLKNLKREGQVSENAKCIIEKVYFKPQDIVAVGTNSIYWQRQLGMVREINPHICVSRFVLNEKDR